MALLDIFVILLMAVPVVAVILCVRYAIRWRGSWRAAALAPVVLLFAWLWAVLLRWPSDHTLWPFELLVYGPAALGYILIARYRRMQLETTSSRSLGGRNE